jgi:type II secretory pathway pseudopilin PulG
MLMNKQKAFTTVELLIATAVFSLVLVVAIFGFLQIGQIFYKGVTVTRTQDTAEDAINNLAADVRFAGVVAQSSPQPAGNGSSQYFCAGNHRYTFTPGQMLVQDNDASTFALIRDDLNVSGSCAPPFGPGSVPLNNPTELLGERMRVSVFSVSRLAGAQVSDMYTLRIRIAYGDNTVLQNTGDSNPANDTCDSSLSTSQYCHVADLTTTVRRGF